MMSGMPLGPRYTWNLPRLITPAFWRQYSSPVVSSHLRMLFCIFFSVSFLPRLSWVCSLPLHPLPRLDGALLDLEGDLGDVISGGLQEVGDVLQATDFLMDRDQKGLVENQQTL